MKAEVMILGLMLTGWFADPGRAVGQDPFLNLNFEFVPFPLEADEQYRVPISSAMIGWTGYLDGQQVDWAFFNTVSAGSAAISFHGPGSGLPAPQGRYWAGVQPLDHSEIYASLGQTGKVPEDALSITFLTLGHLPLQLSFAGIQVPLQMLGTVQANGQEYDLRGGDISSFAGQTGELLFSGGSGAFDDIRFSSQPVPEPGGILVIGLISVMGAICWKRRKGRSEV